MRHPPGTWLSRPSGNSPVRSIAPDSAGPLHGVLLSCLAINDVRRDHPRVRHFLASGGDVDALCRFAERHECLPHVAHALARCLPAGPQVDLAVRTHASAGQRIRALMAVLDEVADALKARGIPLVALKNGGIARGIHDCPACCPMGDLDVLVRREDFIVAASVVRQLGFRIGTRSRVEEATFEAGLRSGGLEFVRTSGANEVWLELQWRAIAGRWIPRTREPGAGCLMDRSVPIPGSAVRLLAPEDNLLQVCLHTAKHSYVRAPGLRLHTDVDRLVGWLSIDWDRFLERVRQVSLRSACYFSLLIPRVLLGTPIPDQVFAALRPRAWKEKILSFWIRAAGLFEPHEPKFSRVGLLAFQALLYDDLRAAGDALAGVESSEGPGSAWTLLRSSLRGVHRLLSRYERS